MIDGVPHSMSPSPGTAHQRFSLILASQILNTMLNSKDSCKDCTVLQDIDWLIADDTVMCPDISIVCDHKTNYITTIPVLLIEIVSPTSGLRDRIVKYDMYQGQGVKYYIIADPATGTYTAYQIIDGKYQEYSLATFAIHEGCTLTIDVAKALTEIGK